MARKENDIKKIEFSPRTNWKGEEYVHVKVEDRKGRYETLDAPDRDTGRQLGIDQMRSRQQRDEEKERR